MGLSVFKLPASTLFVLLLGTATLPNSHAHFDDPDWPPTLTFEDHIDYLSWYDNWVSRNKKLNALSLYLKLCSNEKGEGDLTNRVAELESQINDCSLKTWDPAAFPVLKRFMDDARSQIDLFKQATEISDFWQPHTPGTQLLIETELPLSQISLDMMQILSADAWMMRPNQIAHMIDNWTAILNCAKHLRNDPRMIMNLRSAQLRNRIYSQLACALRDHVITNGQMTRFLDMLYMHDPGSSDFRKAVASEWLSCLDTFQYLAPDGRLNDEKWRGFMKRFAGQEEMPKFDADSLDPRIAVKESENYFVRLCDLTSPPLTLERFSHLSEFQSKSHKRLRKKSMLAAILMADIARCYQLMLRVECHKRGTTLLLRIHIFHEQTGGWPKELSLLLTKDGKSLSIDPYSNEEYIYRVTDSGFTLYSVGADGKDDKGRHDPKWGEGPGGGDYVFWPVQDAPRATSQPSK